jgi:hypothetical protein
MLTDTVSIEQFAQDNRISMTAERTDSNPNMVDSSNMDHWKCVLARGKKRMTVYFSMGYGHKGAEPRVDEVLSCLSSDSVSVADHDFEEWCSELGYETDSRKAEKTFKTCEHQAKRLQNFLGLLYDQLLYHTEGL